MKGGEGKEGKPCQEGKVWQLWAIHVSHHHLRPQFAFFPLFSRHVGVDSQRPCPLNLSLMSSDFLFHIKESDETGERESVHDFFEGVRQAFV